MPEIEIQEKSRASVVRKSYEKLALESLGKVEEVTEVAFSGGGVDNTFYS